MVIKILILTHTHTHAYFILWNLAIIYGVTSVLCVLYWDFSNSLKLQFFWKHRKPWPLKAWPHLQALSFWSPWCRVQNWEVHWKQMCSFGWSWSIHRFQGNIEISIQRKSELLLGNVDSLFPTIQHKLLFKSNLNPSCYNSNLFPQLTEKATAHGSISNIYSPWRLGVHSTFSLSAYKNLILLSTWIILWLSITVLVSLRLLAQSSITTFLSGFLPIQKLPMVHFFYFYVA